MLPSRWRRNGTVMIWLMEKKGPFMKNDVARGDDFVG
jgi:hypothetical protein